MSSTTGIQLVHANEMKSLKAWGIERGSRLRLTGDGAKLLRTFGNLLEPV